MFAKKCGPFLKVGVKELLHILQTNEKKNILIFDIFEYQLRTFLHYNEEKHAAII